LVGFVAPLVIYHPLNSPALFHQFLAGLERSAIFLGNQ
jgi:hypothetical protein